MVESTNLEKFVIEQGKDGSPRIVSSSFIILNIDMIGRG